MAANIKDILDALPEEDRSALMYSFEHGLSYHVKFDGNKFIGVNIANIPYLYPDTKAGFWSVGRVADGTT